MVVVRTQGCGDLLRRLHAYLRWHSVAILLSNNVSECSTVNYLTWYLILVFHGLSTISCWRRGGHDTLGSRKTQLQVLFARLVDNSVIYSRSVGWSGITLLALDLTFLFTSEIPGRILFQQNRMGVFWGLTILTWLGRFEQSRLVRLLWRAQSESGWSSWFFFKCWALSHWSEVSDLSRRWAHTWCSSCGNFELQRLFLTWSACSVNVLYDIWQVVLWHQVFGRSHDFLLWWWSTYWVSILLFSGCLILTMVSSSLFKRTRAGSRAISSSFNSFLYSLWLFGTAWGHAIVMLKYFFHDWF